MTQQQKPAGIHLTGGVNLPDAETVFRTLSRVLGNRLRRAPDGETGVRRQWLGWQSNLLASHPQLQRIGRPEEGLPRTDLLELRPGVRPEDLVIEDLGYARVARDSYAIFSSLKAQGVLPAHWRFQVSIPSAFGFTMMYVRPDMQAAFEPAYARRQQQELQQICAAIPHEEMAIQWDIASEFGLLEGVFPAYIGNDFDAVIERLATLGNSVPLDVEAGFHLCYGDHGHEHFKQPADMGILVRVANGIAAGIARPLNWIHMPVPHDRSDDAYFAPLKTLELSPETELYLGLVAYGHHNDGPQGAWRRVGAAARAAPVSFGISTECGLAREPEETVMDVLEVLAEAADPVV